MKLLLLFAATLGLATCAVFRHVPLKPKTRNLHDVLEEFVALLPLDEIINLAQEKLEIDPEFQAAFNYIASDEFVSIVNHLKKSKAFRDFIQYLRDAGLDMDKAFQWLSDLFGWPEGTITRKPKNLHDTVLEFIDLLPLDEIYEFALDKLSNDADFQALVAKLQSPEFKEIVDHLRKSPEYQKLLEKLKEHGFDVDHIQEVIADFLGWTRSPRDLGDILDEFVALIPLDDIIALAQEKLENDPVFQAAFNYLASDEFVKIINHLKQSKAFTDFIQYIREAGLDVDKAFQWLSDLFDWPEGTITRSRSTLPEIVEEFIALLPLDEILSLALDKLSNDPDFQDLVAKLQSPEFKEIVDHLNKSPEYQKLLDKLRELGFDVDHILSVIHDFLDWTRSPRDLGDILDEFVALIPLDDIILLAQDKLENDPVFQAAFNYLASDEFVKIINHLKESKAFRDFIQYLRDAGLDVDKAFQWLSNLFDWPEGTITRSRSTLPEIVEEFIALLPLDEILSLALDKLSNDPDFQDLVAKLQSPEFKEIVDHLQKSPEYQKLLDKLRELGFDVDHILSVIHDFLGWTRTPRDLGDILDEFVALIPLDDIIALAQEKLENDPVFQAAFNYLASEDFVKIINHLKVSKAFRDFIQYLRDAGLDVDKAFKWLSDLFDWPEGTITRSVRRRSTLPEIVEEFIALLPLDELLALALDKLSNDPDFQDLVSKLQSPEFKEIVDHLHKSSEYQKLLDKLRELGFDVDHIQEVISSFLGWTRM